MISISSAFRPTRLFPIIISHTCQVPLRLLPLPQARLLLLLLPIQLLLPHLLPLRLLKRPVLVVQHKPKYDFTVHWVSYNNWYAICLIYIVRSMVSWTTFFMTILMWITCIILSVVVMDGQDRRHARQEALAMQFRRLTIRNACRDKISYCTSQKLSKVNFK